MSKIITGCKSTQYGCCSDGTTSKEDKEGTNCPTPNPTPTPTPTPAPQREYDQIVSADVKIKKVSKSDHEYEITLVSNVSKVLLYQVWSPNSAALNSNRKVFEMKAKEWVKVTFRKVENGNIPYAPTCIMELDNGKTHLFVINKAKVINFNVVFYVSSKNITLPSKSNKKLKSLKKIPRGEFHNVRFDIDAWDYQQYLNNHTGYQPNPYDLY